MGISREEFEKQKLERLGYEGVANCGSRFKVINYEEARRVEVEFLGNYKKDVYLEYSGDNDWRRNRVWSTWKNICKGAIKDPFAPNVYGIGCTGASKGYVDYNENKQAYEKWVRMLQRCYDASYQKKHPSYIGCTVCKRWLCFEYFKEDYEELIKEYNFTEGSRLDLDKDILNKNNKNYSKENCVIIDQRINVMFAYSRIRESGLPCGVGKAKRNKANPYKARVRKITNGKIVETRPYFPTPELAFNAFKNSKEQEIKRVADEYVALGYITKESRLYKAMYSWVVEIID